MKKTNEFKNDIQNAIDENLLNQIDSKIESKNNSSGYKNFKDIKDNINNLEKEEIPTIEDIKNCKLQVYIDNDLANKLALFMKKNNLSQSKAVKYILRKFFER